MFKKTKTFEQITSAFQRPLDDLKAFIAAKNAESVKLGNERQAVVEAHAEAVKALTAQCNDIDDRRALVNSAADEAQSFHDRLEQFLKG